MITTNYLMFFINWLNELNPINYLIRYLFFGTQKLQMRYQNARKNKTYLIMSCSCIFEQILNNVIIYQHLGIKSNMGCFPDNCPNDLELHLIC